jgi:YD repeat-containing protein
MIWSALRAGAFGCALLGLIVLATPVRAETPVDQCTDSGSGAGPMPTIGTGMQPEPNFVTRPAVSATINLGTVNRRNGAFVYSVEDLSLGAGEFPARLGLVRTYSSDQDGPLGVDVAPLSPFMPGSIQWFAFGRGATHNLDIRFEISPQSFNGQVYQMVVIRTGFDTETFQQCLDGQYRNSRANGSRLFADSTYGAGGFRLEMRDGSVVLFQKFVPASGGDSCGRAFGFSRTCGVARKWSAPNGDWAQFEYQAYYSHPTNRSENAFIGPITNWFYNAATTECYQTFAGQNECHIVAFPTYYSTSAQSYPAILSYPVFEQRLTRVTNSRGYELLFNYVDTTVDAGGYCSGADSSGQLMCATPAKNLSLARNRIQSVVGNWVSPLGQTTQLGQVAYSYANCLGWAADCLSSIQTSDLATTLINRTSNSLSIQLPGESTPATTVTFTTAPHSYYYPDRPRGWYTTNPRLTRNYYRVSTQSFADGTSVSYAVTFDDRWIAEPYGMWARQPYAAAMQVTQAGGAVTTYDYVDTTDEHSGPVSITDPLNRSTTNTYSPVGALASTTLPEGQVIQYSYDVRGNLLSTTRNPRQGSTGLVPLVERFDYWAGPTVAASACTNQVLCNRPIRQFDARNFQTDFVWDNVTGLPISVTRPADPNGQRPTITYGYSSFTGASSASIQLLTSRTERLDAARNIVTNYGYGANIRLPLREVARTDGSTTQRTCLAADMNGNQISLTEPNANLGVCP